MLLFYELYSLLLNNNQQQMNDNLKYVNTYFLSMVILISQKKSKK